MEAPTGGVSSVPGPQQQAPPEIISGPATVIDGDSLEIGNARIRLFGIDAPEGRQDCEDADGTSYRCGRVSAASLAALVRGKTVRCTQHDVDIYGRIVAVCVAGGVELNAAQVEAGMAVAYRRYSNAYEVNEERAKAAHRGLWAGSFEMPSAYRRQHRRGP